MIHTPDQEVGIAVTGNVDTPKTEKLIHESISSHEIPRKLTLAIKKLAWVTQASPPNRYTYEGKTEFTPLVRFIAKHNI